MPVLNSDPINTNVDKIRNEVNARLPETLTKQGFKVGPGGWTYSVSAQESATGKNIAYEVEDRPGPGPNMGNPFKTKKRTLNIPERQIVVKIAVTDQQGKQIFADQETNSLAGHVQANVDDNQFQKMLYDGLISTNASTLSQKGLPTHLFRINGQVDRLPISIGVR